MAIWMLVAGLSAQDHEWGVREWGSATESLRQGDDWSHHYLEAEATFPLCAKTFHAAHVGTHTTSGVDLDFKIRDYVSANPCLFRLWMCPPCNFCSYPGDFEAEKPPERDKEKLKKAIEKPVAYDSYFDIKYSALLRRAKPCAAARQWTDEQLAWLCQYGAWVARDSKQTEAEQTYHLKAQEKFVVLAEKGEGNTKAAAAYLVAKIHRRKGAKDQALEWLEKAQTIADEVKSPNIPDWIKACRAEIEDGSK